MLLPGHKRHRAEKVDSPDLIVVAPFVGRFRPDSLFLQPGQRFFIGRRFAEVIALHFFTAHIPEITELFLCFHAFHQRVDIDALGHFHHRGGDPFRPEVKGMEETHVQFDLVKGKFLEGIQGGIGAAEVVHPDLKAGRTEPVHNALQHFLLFGHYALGNFKVDKVMGNLVVADDLVRNGKDIAKGKVQPGQIHRNGNGGLAFRDAAPDPRAGLPEDCGVQPVDRPFLFQYRDKFIWINHTQFRIDPAGQCLKAAQLPGRRTDDRLIIRLDFVTLYCLFIIFLNKIFQISSHLFLHASTGYLRQHYDYQINRLIIFIENSYYYTTISVPLQDTSVAGCYDRNRTWRQLLYL